MLGMHSTFAISVNFDMSLQICPVHFHHGKMKWVLYAMAAVNQVELQ